MKSLKWLLIVCAALAMAGCVSFGGGGEDSLDDLDPDTGKTFSLRLSLYSLDGSGKPVRTEGGVVELEKYAIEELQTQGFNYVPGDPKQVGYAVDFHLLCFDPKQMAGAEAPVNMEFYPTNFGPDALPVPGEAAAFGPDVEHMRMAPDACAALVQTVVKTGGEDGQAYEKEVGIRAPYTMGCPVPACGPTFRKTLRSVITEYF